ncbi:tripartite tricarboxylate transporter permease [Geosporobacter ferrireducens]|uniref:Trap-t family transporter n=1 Tax=Geosporobacter ferrireducens TaxID=1424294 RepID=A0A1D8GFC5_9FIRM|nr:tripartite tricarboxylate transporter permease [Geosporobacter ferrireducens]AOT69598.1 trap-t family transporter [Geosporobacter ferrireducens]MTI54704.1 trap-t family transporter [Geosporobacter ferrireducens]
MGDMLVAGFQIVFAPMTFLLICAGTVLGVIFGAMPGVSASMAVALAMPFAYAMSPIIAIAFLVAVYCASITGGGITAILFKIPGTPSSAPTTFDGYPLAVQGKAGKALGTSLVCSAIGGVVAAVAMFLLSPQLADVALKFGPSELFAVSFLGLSVLTALDSDNVIKTLISGLIGLLLATVGMDPLLAIPRFTWGNSSLLSGIEMIPVMIGMFAITEVLKQTAKPSKLVDTGSGSKVKTDLLTFKEAWSIKWTIIRSSIIGTLVGILPGAGATIASFLSYTTEVKMSKNPEKFGQGAIEGVAASEAANNAATGGSMVPLLALGIPGGNAAAIMMSALVLKGVQVGPLLVKTQPDYLSSVFASMIVTNIIMVIIAMGIAKVFSSILKVPYSILGPAIVLFAVIGSFALQNSTGDVMLMAIAGILGFAFSKFKFSSAALVLGLVLGGMTEANLRRAVSLANGDIMAVISKPITATLLLACMLMLLYPVISRMIKTKKKATA